MRKGLAALTLLASVALVLPSNAQTTSGSNNTNFITGYTPQNIVNKPMSFTSNMNPINMQLATMPATTGPKVFNISSAFSNIQFPGVTPTRGVTSVPVKTNFPANSAMTPQQQQQMLQKNQQLQQQQFQQLQQQ
jgi:hypothetical protein